MAHSEMTTGTYSLRTVGTEGKQRYWLVAVSSVVALIVSLAAGVISPGISVIATALMVAIIAWGWPAASGLTVLRGTKWIPAHSALFAACGWISCAVVYFAPVGRLLALLPAVVAVGVVVAFLIELLRGEGAAARLESIITAAVGVLASVSAAGWVGMSLIHSTSQASVIVWGSGVVIAVCIAIVGVRMISAGPRGGPRRGAMTLGVTPVAFLGILGYAGALVIDRVIV